VRPFGGGKKLTAREGETRVSVQRLLPSPDPRGGGEEDQVSKRLLLLHQECKKRGGGEGRYKNLEISSSEKLDVFWRGKKGRERRGEKQGENWDTA